jgi:hypothetical protein
MALIMHVIFCLGHRYGRRSSLKLVERGTLRSKRAPGPIGLVDAGRVADPPADESHFRIAQSLCGNHGALLPKKGPRDAYACLIRA